MTTYGTKDPGCVGGQRAIMSNCSVVSVSKSVEKTMQSKPRGNTTDVVESYTATYAFNDNRRQTVDGIISSIRKTVMGMQDDGIDIELLGATGEFDVAGHVLELTARYTAPSKGTVGRLNTRAGLPASGSPQRTTRNKFNRSENNRYPLGVR